MKTLCFAVLAALAVASPLTADEPQAHQHQHSGTPPEKLGVVHFPVSCSEEAQRRFARATALLHSFWYDEAAKAYADVLAADPSCGMAHWGVAMSYYHPIWAPPAPDELSKGSQAAQRAKAAAPAMKTERERAYVAAVAAFYDGAQSADHRTRALRFEKALEAVARDHPGDHEAAVFHALALLGTALPTDKTYANQKKAAAILTKVLPDEPEHPGVAHLIIHSYDYPELAELGLDAARAYAKIAPSSPHALHMPSHIFTRLGLWDESIASNLASAASAKAHVEKTLPGAASFDQLHALDYLEYAHLQEGDDARARAVLEQVSAAQKFDLPNFAAAYCLAAVPARYALERRSWKEAAALTVRPAGFPWKTFPYAEAIVHFARSMGAARSGDVAAARQALARLDAIHGILQSSKDVYWAGQVDIQRKAAAGWIAHAGGKDDEALALLRSASELEDKTDKHPVTPGPVLPAREQLGDLLLELGKPAEALKEYEASNRISPNRFNGLLGAGRSAEKAGDAAKARELYGKLVVLGSVAQGGRPVLAEAQAYLGRR